MGSIENISELCRLCLVKDQVNVPIFEENASKEQTFVKINSCLPVKVSRDDSLPKKICDGCSCKLDMLYNFRNTSVDSEKQLLKWLNQADLSCSQSAAKDPLASTKPEIMIKQETFEPTDSRGDDNSDMGMDTHSYLMQQQKLPYPQEFEFGGPSESNVGLMTDEPAPKRAKRAAALNKAPIETDDDDLDAAMQITKAEEEDSEEIDQPDYVEAPSTSADDQPGPSGVGKASVEAPCKSLSKTTDGLFECQVCQKVYSSLAKLNKHKSRHGEKKHKCSSCDKRFALSWELRTHISVWHVEENNLSCEFCDYKTRGSNSLKSHVIRKHTRDFKFKCDECNSGYICAKDLTNHKKIAHESLRFVCEFCSKVFRNCYNFKNHVKVHDPDYVEMKFPCPHCSKVFKKYELQKHVKLMHSGESGKYFCDICGKILTTNTSLKNHKKVHSGEKNFVCEVCGKAFLARYTLRNHIRVHTKEKPYKCIECETAFSQKSSLNIHMRYHTGERPYKCDLCKKQFITKSVLNTHKCKGFVAETR
ncbi:zinc finger protein 679-like isoform X21 [Tribolium madens]|uniref:zinc finger protein 679-like isoform X21 n=1 Tax=Tribolium madens TaxID=41895 RepID=UPI001CF724A5|nr:zinc finger protein 679-like isoform X21 [Tribolium madens]